MIFQGSSLKRVGVAGGCCPQAPWDLSLSRQSGRVYDKRAAGMKKIIPSAVLAPESALRSRPRVAVSSAQSKEILGRTERICKRMNENELFRLALGLASP